ncbi:MAG: hypothetical protein J6C64_11635 [Lachnospiraceae bacterium]|nr:hypothetical protein [Lachnospiraceae bacterium]
MYKKIYVTTNLKRLFLILGTVAAVLFIFFINTFSVKAAEGLTLYTDSSGINTTAGESLSFNLYVSNTLQNESDVNLSIESMPEGFTGFFKRDSYEVNRVHASQRSENAIASFQITVPKETPEGQYEIILKASTDEGQEDTLPITLNISELESGESNFTVEYPRQEGVSGTSFTYSTTIVNNTLTDQTYSFSYDAPSGWQVAFKSSSDSTQVSSIDIESGNSQGITITVTPPEKVEAGEYEIKCSAVSAKETMQTALNVKILGTYDLELSTSDGRLSLDANANKESSVTLRLTNSGNIDLENINLTSNAPTGWEVTFNESTIDTLEAGATKEIKATIKPDSDALTGDYVTYINADTSDQSASVQFRITVKTQTVWGIVAVLIIIGVLTGLWYITRKYGRR